MMPPPTTKGSMWETTFIRFLYRLRPKLSLVEASSDVYKRQDKPSKGVCSMNRDTICVQGGYTPGNGEMCIRDRGYTPCQ